MIRRVIFLIHINKFEREGTEPRENKKVFKHIK